ncbi:condensation domain-containing protein [Streptomyces sp. NPDC004629]|uniref:non-ribosomal peptide synthetase n=1 Tax=Streptomyces sp. NPDC004629 TaxID=3364705 RepID=UPI0036BC6579
MTTHPPFPLTPAQRRLWALARMRPGDPFFSIPFAVTIDGPLHGPALAQALDHLLRRHPALRTRITRNPAGEPVQAVAAPEPVRPALVDCAEADPAGREKRAAEHTARFARTPFALEDGPLFRTELLRLDENTHRLLVAVHHIVFDGASLDVFTSELATLYDAFALGRPAPLPEPTVSYTDFLTRRAELDERNRAAHLRYWTRRLAGAPDVLELPVLRPRPVHSDHAGGRRTTVIPSSVVEPLRRLARGRRATLFMVLKAACDVVLGRFGGTAVLTGMAVSGRDSADSAGIVGYLARPVVLRSDLSDDLAFGELVTRVRDDVLDAHDHADLPFDEVIDALGVTRDMSRHPLYQVMYTHQSAAPVHLAAGARLTVGELRLPTMKVDLAVDTVETDDGLLALVDYRTDLFDAATADRILGRLRTVLERVGADPGRTVFALGLPGEGERVALLDAWNPARDEPAEERCLHDLVEEQALRTPDAVAVETARQSWTYRELDTAADRVAHRLHAHGTAPETRVGICVTETPERVAALLGVLKAGGVCVPLDPALPAFRLRLAVDEIGIDTVVADARSASLFDHTRLHVLQVAPAAGGGTPRVRARVSARNAAWILHTSGTTSEPRAVVAEHRNLVSRLRWAGRNLPEGALDSVASCGPVDSHRAVFEVFAPLIHGGRVSTSEASGASARYVVPPVPVPVPVPVAVAPAAPQSHPHTLITGGDLLIPEAVQEAHEAGARHLHHLYTCAETAGPALGGPLAPGEPVTLGLPAGCTAYVLDPSGRLVPPGVIGELHIGGAAVTRGYAEQPRLTAERYLPDPFATRPGSRLYATGDLVRHTCDGRLVFAGRAGQQAVVRGTRVAFADVEAALLAHPEVARAVVTRAGDEDGAGAGDRLVAAVTARPGASPTEEALRAYLLERLPGPMRPARIAVLDRLPLLPGGAPDRARIATALHGAAPPSTEEQPLNETERLVARAWQTVLGRPVATGENFFDAGGNSLLLIRLQERLHTALGRRVDVVDLFRHSTVRAMAAFLAGGAAGKERAAGADRRAQARLEALRARGRGRGHDRRR